MSSSATAFMVASHVYTMLEAVLDGPDNAIVFQAANHPHFTAAQSKQAPWCKRRKGLLMRRQAAIQ
jgi:hypothetical protein